MTDQWFALGVLVGYGSIGRAHGRVLSARCEALVIVDGSPGARAAAAADHPSAAVVASLEEVIGSRDLREAVVVLATWGPSHAELFDLAVDAGCRHVLVEKPIAHSVAGGAAMVARAADDGVALGVNYVRRYGREAEAIRELADRLSLGPAVGAVVHGGARGLVTNGIHVVELVCDLLDADPVAVTSTARAEPINPRSPDLSFYLGTAVWSYPGHRELVVSFPSGSSVKEHLVVYHRDAIITVAPGPSARVQRRPAAEVAAHPAITYTGFPSEVVWEGELPGSLTGDARLEEALRAVRDRDGGRLRAAHHTRSLGACIGALASGETGVRVSLPIDPQSTIGLRPWPIS